MDDLEKERIRIRTEERTRITAKIVSQIGDLLLEDLKQSGGSKSNTFAKKKETKKPQNFHHKKGSTNGPRLNQNANQNINIFCSTNQNQTFHNKSPSCPKQSNGVKFKPQGNTESFKYRNSPATRGGKVHASTSSRNSVHITSGNANQHINVYSASHQRQSFSNANSPHPKQSVNFKSKPPGMKAAPIKQHNFQPKNNQTGNSNHSNNATNWRKPVARANKGPMPSQNVNQHINVYCTLNQQQSFNKANSSGTKQSGVVKSKPQGNKPGANMNHNSKF